jgi:hypothetical protein
VKWEELRRGMEEIGVVPATELGLPTMCRHRFAMRCAGFCLCVALLLVFLLFDLGGTSAAASAILQNTPAITVGRVFSFVVADFDGDRYPDLAAVEARRIDSSFTDYSIRLQLSASGRHAIQLLAPSGGLLIEARDVNGDRAVDLVLSTAWLRQPVAIFLNDGHGSFSRVEPTALPGAFANTAANRASSSNQGAETVGIPPQPRSGIFSEATNLPDVRRGTDPIFFSSSLFLFDSPFISEADRAPPSDIS